MSGRALRRGEARRLRAWSLAVAISLCLQGLAATGARAEEAQEEAEKEAELRHPSHAWNVELRVSPQLSWIAGDIEASRKGQSENVDIQDDIGLDDPELAIAGSLALRWKRHEVTVSGYNFESKTRTTIRRTLDFDGIPFPISRKIRAKTEYLNVDFRYGYSLWDLEKHGFRLGPTISIGYFRFKASVKDIESGETGDIEEELPLPTLGLQGEIPWRRFLLRADVSGLYINTSGFEGTGIRTGGSLVWRPFKHIGIVGGYRYIFADVDDGRDDYEITCEGPSSESSFGTSVPRRQSST